MDQIIALDIGTTGTKAAMFAYDGRLLVSGYATYDTVVRAGNVVEQNPLDWWRAVVEALAQLQQSAASATSGAPAAIVLTGQMQDLILLGQEDTLGPAILYSDSRATKEVEQLNRLVDKETLGRVTGNDQGAASLVTKWLWLLTHEPERIERCQSILIGAHDYVTWRLCGNLSADYTTAATTGLMDLQNNCWATDLLERLGLDADKLPPLVSATTTVGEITAEAAAATGLPSGTPVIRGAGDLAATTIGVGAGEPGRLYLYLGTSGWVACSQPETIPKPEEGIFTLRHPNPTQSIQVAPMVTAGGNLDWARQELGDNGAFVQMNELAAKATVGSDGLLYLPYLAGERSPFSDPHARGCFIGLSQQTTKAEMVRAVMEGTALAYRTLCEALNVEQGEALTLVGGGAKSVLWSQILADVLATPVHIPADAANATTKGAAIIGGLGLGWYDSYYPNAAFFPTERSHRPDSRTESLYSELYAIFRELYPQLRDSFAALAQSRANRA